MQSSILATAVDLHYDSLNDLAAAWIDAGMDAVFITELDGRIVVQWPAVAIGSHAALSSPIMLNGEAVGKLHLCGEVNSSIAFRLAADAQLLSNIVQLEYELESMTTDIIDQQDQLMALHQLAQTTRVYNDVRKTLGDLAKITSQLLKTEVAFMVLQTEGKAPLPVLYPPKEWPQDLWCKLVSELEQTSDKRQWLLQQQDEPLRRLAVPIRNLLLKKMTVRPGIALILGAANKIVGEFQAPDLKLFSTIAEPAGANLENAILHQEILDQTRIQTEMELAKQVQMRLLPQRTPQLPGLELAAQSRSAFQVGGDFYDFIDSHGHLLTFTLGDVSGKGMPAALLMSMLHTVLGGKAKEMDVAAPEVLLNGTNEFLYDDFSEVSMFATVFVGQYDCQKHVLHYANHGHAPVIYRAANGQAVLLPADAPPLGVLPVGLAERQTIEFQPGDILAVASDGFSEAERQGGEMFGYDRLLQFIDQCAAYPADELMKQLFSAIQDFVGSNAQSDDQTLLILRRTEVHEPSA